jgi:HlyD family secretion protein
VKRTLLFILSIAGILAGIATAYYFGIRKPPLPPAFPPSVNPYPSGIFASGIIESYQFSGANLNLYPEVAGPVVEILVSEGERVPKGAPLLKIDDSVQRPTVDQQRAQAEAAQAALEELRAQPRAENLAVSRAQVESAGASLRLAQDTYEKKKIAYALSPDAVSKDDLDTAENNVRVQAANLELARRQYELLKAGAWEFDIRTQEHQVEALRKAYSASNALLEKYVLRAPSDGVVLAINVAVGAYTSPQGAYDTYTQGFGPVLVMGSPESRLAVRCYVDEILVHRLPRSSGLKATMIVRGTSVRVPLEFVRTTPYVSPKIQLSNERTERVDVRVLPVIFRFKPPPGIPIFPGQLVDVYIEGLQSVRPPH